MIDANRGEEDPTLVMKLYDGTIIPANRHVGPVEVEERLARLADADTPERVLSQFERRRQLQLALDDLPGEQREVLLLRLEQELTLEEIGAVTGVGRETVKSRLRYAMDKLRARLPS